MHDIIIVGGSYAGISAGLQLARARRDLLVLDAGQRRNRTATASHGFLGQDGQDPGAIAAKGRAELLAYPTVTWRDAAVTDAQPVPGGFAVRAGTDVELDTVQRDDLAVRGLQVERVPVVEVAGDAPAIDVRLEDGRALRFNGLFLQPRTRPALALAESLGCALDEGPLGPFIRTDETKESTARGVFACGDVARGMGSVAFAVGDGARAGMAAHQSLLLRPAE